MHTYLDFESQVAELEGKDCRAQGSGRRCDPAMSIDEEVSAARAKAAKTPRAKLYATLTPWQKAQVARHPDRPHCLDYIGASVQRLHPARRRPQFRRGPGDRRRLRRASAASPWCVIGQEKGHDTQSRLKHNFGMARPEGYRKAVRLMELADRFNLPVLTLWSTPPVPIPASAPRSAARPKRSPARPRPAWRSRVPSISVIIGEGGSGGAIAHRHRQPRATCSNMRSTR